jgi:hypothetical protein
VKTCAFEAMSGAERQAFVRAIAAVALRQALRELTDAEENKKGPQTAAAPTMGAA